MKRVLWTLVAGIVIGALVSCSNPMWGGGGSPSPSPAPDNDIAFWFEGIYLDLLDRERNGSMGQIANCQFVCDALKLRRPNSTLVPAVGHESDAATTKYLLSIVDRYNEYITGRSTEFGISKYANNQIVDTIAVNNALDLLWGTGGKFVAGRADNICYSTDGINWARLTFFGEWRGVAYGKGVFVAISINRPAYSTDGINWVLLPLFNTSIGSWNCKVAYGNGRFVTVGNAYNKTAHSTDGINWIVGDMLPGEWWNITYGNGLFVAVGRNNAVAYSRDGLSWFYGTISPGTGLYQSVVCGNGLFIAVGYLGVLARSTDGITWEEEDFPSSSGDVTVLYGKGMFVIVCRSSIYYSNNGKIWSIGSIPSDAWYCSAYGNGRFVAGDFTDTAYSTDGINWFYGAPAPGTFYEICYGGY